MEPLLIQYIAACHQGPKKNSVGSVFGEYDCATFLSGLNVSVLLRLEEDTPTAVPQVKHDAFIEAARCNEPTMVIDEYLQAGADIHHADQVYLF